MGTLVMFFLGYKLDNSLNTDEIPKCVLVCAPHTSNWDFFIAISAFWKMCIPMKVFIKDSYTKPWYGFIFRYLGCIGVDRSKRANMTDYAAELLSKSDKLYMISTPEGTRSWSERWKLGFYYIAQKAEVPILLGYADYQKKISGISKKVETKNRTIEEVLDEIQAFYIGIQGKHPEQYNPKIY